MEVKMIHNLNCGHMPGSNRTMPSQEQSKNGLSFRDMLKGQASGEGGLKFSRHATKRLEERGITIDNRILNNLERAVEEARRKGARDVAVIGGRNVFIVNVPNNVVVTTMTQEEMKDRILTNIDSAVLM